MGNQAAYRNMHVETELVRKYVSSAHTVDVFFEGSGSVLAMV